MLRKDVVEAVSRGEFHIYPVRTIDQGIEILTGKPAGKRKVDGSYPKGSVNDLVDQKLRQLAEGLSKFGKDDKKAKKRAKKKPAAPGKK
jgi:ATP-dependent Lon protease